MKKCLFILLICIAMIGCAAHRPIISNASDHKQEHTHTQSHISNVVDSTLIDRLREVIVRNDTVYIRDSIYIYKWRDRQITDSIHDTLYIQNTDTIINRVEVEKPIAPFVRNSCITLWVIVGVAILALGIWISRNFATLKLSWLKLIGKIFGI